ncbi:MAG: alpha/beta fold hydrolase [Bacteroidota bacterium]
MRTLLLAALTAGLLGPPLAAQDAIPDGLLGRWAGAATEAGTPLLFDLEFSASPDGALATQLTLPYNGYDAFPFAFAYTPGGPYDGTLTAGLFGDEMRLVVDLAEGHLRGTVVEGDSVTARVHLQRVVDAPRAAITEVAVTFRVGPDTLAGALFVPEGEGPHPGAVLVAGRGENTRYDMIGWAKLLARAGVAALVWDARGAGRSTGDAATVTAESRAAEVHAALDLLRADAAVGPVGLVGYSAAGWIVPDVAADRDDVAFAVVLAGPTGSLADQQAQVTVAFMRASGDPFTEAEFSAASAYQRATVDLAQAGAPWAAFEAINGPARAARWAEHALIPDSLDAPDLVYFRQRAGFDAPAWGRVRAPVLAVYAGADLLVPPEDNVPALRAALAGHPDATVLVIPEIDHSLARPAGFVGEGAWPDRFYRPWTRSPAVLNGLVDWLRTRFVLADPPPR